MDELLYFGGGSVYSPKGSGVLLARVKNGISRLFE